MCSAVGCVECPPLPSRDCPSVLVVEARTVVGPVSTDLGKQDLVCRALGVLACTVLRMVGYGSLCLSC